jgi:hypothetical protein
MMPAGSQKMIDLSYASCRIATSAARTEVMPLVKPWADDLGWVLVRGSESPDEFIVFDATRRHSTFLSLQMGVAASSDDAGGSAVSFTASMMSFMPIETDLKRAAKAFACGVGQELRSLGYEVSPAGVAEAQQDRRRLRRYERFRRAAYKTILIAAIPILAAVGFLTYRNELIFLSVLLWICLAQMSLVYSRWRILGMQQTAVAYYIAFSILVCIGSTLGAAAIAVWG